MIVLGIETSCDETAVAICQNGAILSSLISSQEIHSSYGGVVPELAAREHDRNLNFLVEKSLQDSDLTLKHLNGIAVTQGPGLAGTLLTGICFAKGLAQGMNLPVVGINHLEAHIFANFIADPTLEYPFICLLVSGGHTQLWLVQGMGDYDLMGETRDDAAGEAFDKGARILNLGYPGGPEIEKLAEGGDSNAITFPRAFLKNESFEFSFSGLKTALLYFMDKYNEAQVKVSLRDVAASYQNAIIDVLISKLSLAVQTSGVKTCVIAGGVAANRFLRQKANMELHGTRAVFPDLPLCTDNAAMVAFLGEIKLEAGQTSSIDFSANPNLKLT